METIKKIHFVGIKGVAMTALAVYAKERGIQVSGSDVSEQFPTEDVLSQAQISVLEGFTPAHVRKESPDCVVYTGAHNGRDNVEVQEALHMGLPVYPHAQALGMFMEGKRVISVAGSHGKTTTTAMIATILTVAGLDPSYAVGCGEIFGLGQPGHFGKGEFFVAEADEYVTDPSHDATPRFLWQHPEVLVVTNIDFDHPDVYASLSDVQDAFLKLQSQEVGKKITVLNAQDVASSILQRPESTIVTYGHVPKGNIEVSRIRFQEGKTFFTITRRPKKMIDCVLNVAGVHNVYNAAAAATTCFALGIDWDAIQAGLGRFAGTKRRFERIGVCGGVTFYDDYAHHPAEIIATLTAAHAWYPNHRLIAVFQPHTFSRTKALLADFAKAFGKSDMVIITDIYASAREHDRLGITGETLPQATKAQHRNVIYAPGKEEVKEALKKHVQFGDVVIFMGAGDIYTWGKEIVNGFSI